MCSELFDKFSEIVKHIKVGTVIQLENWLAVTFHYLAKGDSKHSKLLMMCLMLFKNY